MTLFRGGVAVCLLLWHSNIILLLYNGFLSTRFWKEQDVTGRTTDVYKWKRSSEPVSKTFLWSLFFLKHAQPDYISPLNPVNKRHLSLLRVFDRVGLRLSLSAPCCWHRRGHGKENEQRRTLFHHHFIILIASALSKIKDNNGGIWGGSILGHVGLE